uniref:T-box domain-containing protein n=2 Tax=Meloidogyne TaxID=189290 RepID=A0A914M9N1_MELIC
MSLPLSTTSLSSDSSSSSSSSSSNIQLTTSSSTSITTNSFQSSPLFSDPDSTTTPTTTYNSAFTATKEYKIELANSQLWEKFAKVQNEMVVTRPGRKMFPKLELYLHNLDPESQYTLSLYMQKVDNLRYKYQAGGWSAAGHDGENGIQQSNLVQHHEGLCKGKFWTSQGRISFERAKLTNKESLQGGNSMISLSSMSKYQPVILLGKNTPAGTLVLVAEYRPPQCQFIAVTAYQSEAVTKLKVEHNPFAKGFREGSSRKRTLSPSLPTTGNTYFPSLINSPLLMPYQFPSINPLPQQQQQQNSVAAYMNFIQAFQQYQSSQQNKQQQQQQQISPISPQLSSFSPFNIFGQTYPQQQPQMNPQQVRAMANQMLGLMGISGAGVGGGTPLLSQFSPISFPVPSSTLKSWTSPQINNKRNIQDDDESAPTKAKKAKISTTSTPTSQQQLLPLNDIQSPILGGNPGQLTNVNKMSTITG